MKKKQQQYIPGFNCGYYPTPQMDLFREEERRENVIKRFFRKVGFKNRRKVSAEAIDNSGMYISGYNCGYGHFYTKNDQL